MSRHNIAEFVTPRGQVLFLDMAQVEAITEHAEDPLQCVITTGSDSYHVQLEPAEAARIWKEVL